jgi:hypothetical protein
MVGQNISLLMQLQMPWHMMARQSCEGDYEGNQDEKKMAHVVLLIRRPLCRENQNKSMMKKNLMKKL